MSEHARALSRWVDEAPANTGRDPEAMLWQRCAKVCEEGGEVIDALIGATGSNPRKGVTGGLGNVEKELLDVCAAALGAVEHLHGNDGRSMERLLDHLQWLCERVDLKVEGEEGPMNADDEHLRGVNCPDCGHNAWDHDGNGGGCLVEYEHNDFCTCTRNYV